MKKIEEVARAIYAAAEAQRVDFARWGGVPGINPPLDMDRSARAAIEAMREPTEIMVSGMLHEHATNAPYKSPFGPDGSFARQYIAAIDAVLNEGRE